MGQLWSSHAESLATHAQRGKKGTLRSQRSSRSGKQEHNRNAGLFERGRNHQSSHSKSSKAEGSKSRHRPPSRRDSHHHHHDSEATPRVRKECMICTDTLSLRHFPARLPTAKCSHEIDVCHRCLQTWIESQFRTKMWDAIVCPICPSVLQTPDMRDFAPSGVLKRYVFHLQSPSFSHLN